MNTALTISSSAQATEVGAVHGIARTRATILGGKPRDRPAPVVEEGDAQGARLIAAEVHAQLPALDD